MSDDAVQHEVAEDAVYTGKFVCGQCDRWESVRDLTQVPYPCECGGTMTPIMEPAPSPSPPKPPIRVEFTRTAEPIHEESTVGVLVPLVGVRIVPLSVYEYIQILEREAGYA